tara:strand:+ start:49 stop:615 length:567 start_codon:yes stop_codon:yes gene_type:complete
MSWENILKFEFSNAWVNSVNSKLKDTVDKLHNLLGKPDRSHPMGKVTYERKGGEMGEPNFEYDLTYVMLEKIPYEDDKISHYDFGKQMNLAYLNGTIPMEWGESDGYPTLFCGQFHSELFQLQITIQTQDPKVEAIVENFHNYLVSQFGISNKGFNPDYTSAVDENNNPIQADELVDNSWKDSLRGNE